jgi:hypothetical protein
MDEATIRRIIREELDNYDRDKGITPRRSKEGVYASPFNYTPSLCQFCGGHHGSSLPCPKLTPFSTSTGSQPTPPKVRTP